MLQTKKLGYIATGIAALALAGCGERTYTQAAPQTDQHVQVSLPTDCADVLGVAKSKMHWDRVSPKDTDMQWCNVVYLTYKTETGAVRTIEYKVVANKNIDWTKQTPEKPLEAKVQR